MKKGRTHIILTRHGETEENALGILQGHMPGTLSLEGVRQIKEIAEKLMLRRVDAVVSSDLKRSSITAMIVCSAHGIKPIETVMLRERDWGELTGLKADINDYADDISIETYEHMYIRAGMFLDWLGYSFSNKSIVVVGHGCINQAIMAHVKGLGPDDISSIPMMGNTEIIEFDI